MTGRGWRLFKLVSMLLVAAAVSCAFSLAGTDEVPPAIQPPAAASTAATMTIIAQTLSAWNVDSCTQPCLNARPKFATIDL